MKTIRVLREQRGMTQGELAKATGLSTSIVSEIDRGRCKRIRPRAAKALSDALGVDVSDFIDFSGDHPLRLWRYRQGWTQSEVGKRLGVSCEMVQSWESGARRISEKRLKALAVLFGCTAEDLTANQ